MRGIYFHPYQAIVRCLIPASVLLMALTAMYIQRVTYCDPSGEQLYLQETGCAGRDGEPAVAVMLAGMVEQP